MKFFTKSEMRPKFRITPMIAGTRMPFLPTRETPKSAINPSTNPVTMSASMIRSAKRADLGRTRFDAIAATIGNIQLARAAWWMNVGLGATTACGCGCGCMDPPEK